MHTWCKCLTGTNLLGMVDIYGIYGFNTEIIPSKTVHCALRVGVWLYSPLSITANRVAL